MSTIPQKRDEAIDELSEVMDSMTRDLRALSESTTQSLELQISLSRMYRRQLFLLKLLASEGVFADAYQRPGGSKQGADPAEANQRAGEGASGSGQTLREYAESLARDAGRRLGGGDGSPLPEAPGAASPTVICVNCKFEQVRWRGLIHFSCLNCKQCVTCHVDRA